jgi:hypothetical protein
LIRHLYEDLGQATGGPLHWMLDDLNIDDEQVDSVVSGRFDPFEGYAQARPKMSAEDMIGERPTAGCSGAVECPPWRDVTLTVGASGE